MEQAAQKTLQSVAGFTAGTVFGLTLLGLATLGCGMRNSRDMLQSGAVQGSTTALAYNGRSALLAPEQFLPFEERVEQVGQVIQRFAPRTVPVRTIAALIVEESTKLGADPLFVTALVKSESTFRASARSRRNARGLMQITPVAEKEILKSGSLKGIARRSLHDPRYNLRVGIEYLLGLVNRYNGNRLLALVAYNWGPGRVERALLGKIRIPGECLEYASTILENHHKWSVELG